MRASDFVISDSTGAHVFYWNSCGGVERRGEELDFQCDASDVACERGDAGRGRYYGLGKLDTVQFNTVYGRQGLLEARYTGGTETPTGPRRITVEIECDRNAEEPRFEMHHVPSAPNYLLTVKSVHGCVKEAPPAPSPADCRYVGPSGNSYDIGQLVNATSDWMFADTNGHYVYHWNSCSGLGEDLPPDPDTGQDCSAGPNGTPLCGCRAGIDAGCQVHSDDDFGPYSLGTLASAEYRETVASDGSTLLSAFYRDGAESATDPEWGARSMQVDFQCFPEAETPLFRMVSPVGESMLYHITVVSKHGCPLSDDESCLLKDAAGETQYDLGPLVGTTFMANATETPFP